MAKQKKTEAGMRTFILLCYGSLHLAGTVHAAVGHELTITYQAVDQASEQRRDEFPHAVTALVPTYDLTQPGEPVIECTVVFELVTEGHPALDTYDTRDATRQIFSFGGWGTITDLELILRDHTCFD